MRGKAAHEETMFDAVKIRREGAWREISLESFFALPLSERVRHVIQRTVVFLENGQPVDQKTALAELRKARVAA